MKSDIDRAFDIIQRHLDNLADSHDNESMRHDLIIRPFLSNPILLGWNPPELLSQQTTDIPPEINESYVWKGAIPKKRRPDMVIVPYGTFRTVAVIEEKARQKSLENLSRYLGQVKEYQFLHNTVWGLITDGERFILQRNNEIYLKFESLSELKKGFNDLKECIGRDALMKRLCDYGTTDIIVARPSPTIIVVISPHTSPAIVNMFDYLNSPSIDNCDVVKCLCDSLSNDTYNLLKQSESLKQIKSVMSDLFIDIPRDIAMAVNGYTQLLITNTNREFKLDKINLIKYQNGLSAAVNRWAKTYPILYSFLNDIKNGAAFTVPQIIDVCNQIDFKSGDAISRIKHELKAFYGKQITFSLCVKE